VLDEQSVSPPRSSVGSRTGAPARPRHPDRATFPVASTWDPALVAELLGGQLATGRRCGGTLERAEAKASPLAAFTTGQLIDKLVSRGLKGFNFG
jgi:hypothetical protein